MRKQIVVVIISLITILCFGACSGSDSSFCIKFIDVGQGDSALVECDGHYMLIDGGNTSAGDKVYDVLEEQGVQHLDILAVSHMHADHIGGLPKALTYASAIDKTISNTADGNTEAFRDFEHQLRINGSKISVPHNGDKYKLGSAKIEVVDKSSADENDSLVLLITYGENRFLLSGDIGEATQSRIAKQYLNVSDEPYKIDLLKMPHHGAETSILFIRSFMPDYAVISVGQGNQYGHPDTETIDMLSQADTKVYRTDIDGDITVKSDGKQLRFETSR